MQASPPRAYQTSINQQNGAAPYYGNSNNSLGPNNNVIYKANPYYKDEHKISESIGKVLFFYLGHDFYLFFFSLLSSSRKVRAVEILRNQVIMMATMNTLKIFISFSCYLVFIIFIFLCYLLLIITE